MNEYINYYEICENDWIFCDEDGCSDCQYAYDTKGCKISDWIESFPRYEMKMEKIGE